MTLLPHYNPDQWPASPHPYPDRWIASVTVVDDAGHSLMAALVSLQPQAYLKVGECSPAVKLACLRLIHEDLARQLRALGYSECDAEVPPGVSLGRRLRKMGWIRNGWEQWFRRF